MRVIILLEREKGIMFNYFGNLIIQFMTYTGEMMRTNPMNATVLWIIAIPVFGLLIEYGIVYTLKGVCAFIGFFFNWTEQQKRGLLYLLYIFVFYAGVIAHEFAHFIVAVVLRAEIISVDLLDKNFIETGTLGSVEYAPTGGLVRRGLQHFLISSAPVWLGAFNIFWAYNTMLAHSDSLVWQLGLSYLIISIIIHMNMSIDDLKLYLRGIPTILVLGWIATQMRACV